MSGLPLGGAGGINTGISIVNMIGVACLKQNTRTSGSINTVLYCICYFCTVFISSRLCCDDIAVCL